MEKLQFDDWLPTRTMAKVLGVHHDYLYSLVKRRVLREGRHFMNISIDKMRPTYRWNLQEIKKLFEAK